jgi:hypothetical protein
MGKIQSATLAPREVVIHGGRHRSVEEQARLVELLSLGLERRPQAMQAKCMLL